MNSSGFEIEFICYLNFLPSVAATLRFVENLQQKAISSQEDNISALLYTWEQQCVMHSHRETKERNKRLVSYLNIENLKLLFKSTSIDIN